MSYRDSDKQREFGRLWRRKRREAFFKDKCCAKCGSTTNLELDHIDPSQKESHKIWSWSEPRRLAELAKCQVLCTLCHLEKTRLENRIAYENKPIPHGTRNGYQVRKCRCEQCTTAMKAIRSAWNRGSGRITQWTSETCPNAGLV